MTAVTLTTLRARARERADMPVAGFVGDTATGIDAWINEGVQLLHEKLINAYGNDYKESQVALNVVAGTSDYALPADFFKLLGVDLNIYGAVRALRSYTRAERNSLRQAIPSYITVPKYRIEGSNLRLYPATINATGVLFYVPAAALLVGGADTIDVPNGWERYVVLYTAIQMRMKEESDVREMTSLLNKWEQELEVAAQDRNAAFPQQTVDLENIDVIRIL